MKSKVVSVAKKANRHEIPDGFVDTRGIFKMVNTTKRDLSKLLHGFMVEQILGMKKDSDTTLVATGFEKKLFTVYLILKKHNESNFLSDGLCKGYVYTFQSPGFFTGKPVTLLIERNADNELCVKGIADQQIGKSLQQQKVRDLLGHYIELANEYMEGNSKDEKLLKKLRRAGLEFKKANLKLKA